MNKKVVNEDFPAIGANVHRERMRKELTMQELASSSGLSKAMLSQIESNKVNPTVATLWKIARALQVDLDRLISGPSNERPLFEITPKSQQIHLEMDEGKTKFTILSSPNQAEDLEIYKVTLSPDAIHNSKPHEKNTIEYVCILRGKIQITADEQNCVLEAGDYIMMQADVPHSLKNISEVEAEAFMVVRFAK